MAGFVVKSMATVQAEVEKETGRAFTRRTIFDLRQFRLGRAECALPRSRQPLPSFSDRCAKQHRTRMVEVALSIVEASAIREARTPLGARVA